MTTVITIDEARAIHTASAAAVISALPEPAPAMVRAHLMGTVAFAQIPREARAALAAHFGYLELIEASGHGWLIAEELEGIISAVEVDPSVVLEVASHLDNLLPALEPVDLAA